jgi:flagellar biosynthetic protein FliQ
VTQDSITHIAVQALTVTLKISMPFLLAGLVVGLVISVFQAVTQIQEATLSFIPKILVTGAVLALAGPWMLDQIVSYTRELLLGIPSWVGP